MAKRLNEQGGEDKGVMRVMYAEITGNNASLQEGLRTLVAAMHKPVQGVQPPPRRVQNHLTGSTPAFQPEPHLLNQEQDTTEDAEIDVDEQTTTNQNGATRRKRGEGTKTGRNAGIVPISDLDFVPDNQPALKTFFAEKDPGSDMEQVLVFGYYIQQILGLANFGPGHALSAFKHVGKPIPRDLRQTMRNMKPMKGSTQGKGWLNFTNIDEARLTTEGENVVEHELPHSRGNSEVGAK